jgi:hypothetical protein
MKKIILGLLAIGTLTFANERFELLSKNYSKKIVQKNDYINPKLKEAISNFMSKDNIVSFSQEDFETAEIVGVDRETLTKALEEIYKYFSYNVENVKFKSKDLALITIKTSYPDIEKMLDNEYFFENIKKNFKNKLIEDTDLNNKEVYNKTIKEIFFNSLKETLPKLNKNDYSKDEFILEAKKVNNEWQVKMLEN